MWGCLEQLLINKTILEEVTKNHCSIVTMWLDYQKAFDSFAHKWLTKALKLTKVPEKIISALVNLMKKWSTQVNIESDSVNIESKTLYYLWGVFQGDSLSVIFFILRINPLSFLLNKLSWCCMGLNGNGTCNITHLFFVDDLKLYSTNMNNMNCYWI